MRESPVKSVLKVSRTVLEVKEEANRTSLLYEAVIPRVPLEAPSVISSISSYTFFNESKISSSSGRFTPSYPFIISSNSGNPIFSSSSILYSIAESGNLAISSPSSPLLNTGLN